MGTKILTDATDIKKLNASIRTRGVKWEKDVHQSALSTLVHLSKHRDTTLVTDLCNAMPASARGKALIDWFEHFSPITIDYKTKNVTMPKLSEPKWTEWVNGIEQTTESADATPFYNLTQEKGQKDKVTMAAVVAMLQRKANSKDCDPETKANIEATIGFAKQFLTEE